MVVDSYKIDIKKLVLAADFDKEFYRVLSNPITRSQEHAFEILNDTFIAHFGANRYSSFDSYRVSRNRRIRK